MNLTLRDEDRRAVDLLLDRATSARLAAHDARPGLYAAHSSVSTEHLAAAEKVLKRLDLLRAGEPASNLLERTLRRIGEPIAMHAPTSAVIHTGRPVA